MMGDETIKAYDELRAYFLEVSQGNLGNEGEWAYSLKLVAALVDQYCAGDAKQIQAFEQHSGVNLAPYRAANPELTMTEAERDELRAFVNSSNRVARFLKAFVQLAAEVQTKGE
jgi:hypothetical protein